MTSETGWNISAMRHGHKQITEAISCICLMQISANSTPASSGQMLTSSLLATGCFCTYSIRLGAEQKPEYIALWHLLQQTAGSISVHHLQPPSPTAQAFQRGAVCCREVLWKKLYTAACLTNPSSFQNALFYPSTAWPYSSPLRHISP